MSLTPKRARPLANPLTFYVCRQCQQRRRITQKFLQRKQDGVDQWNGFAKEIRAGSRKSLYEVLNERGLVHDVTGDRVAFENLLIDKRVGFYSGVDPTASSMHVGHILPMMPLFWAHFYGCQAVSLIGGSTAKVGDPTGRTTSRPAMTPTERKANMTCLSYQLKKIWLNAEAVARKYGYEEADRYRLRGILNNNVWHNKTPFQEITNVMGSGLRMGQLLSRDTVKTKMQSGEGMSFSEFAYPLLQAWDWWYLYDTRKIQIQVGGQDQFGNLVTGAEAVKYVATTHPHNDKRVEEVLPRLMTPYGFTVPLLTTSSGEKFGKSAGNAIWLDQQQTSVFDLYGFFVRTADADVKKYLKLFTFLPLEEIDQICEKHEAEPSQREAQHKLAYEFVHLIHGEATARATQQEHKQLFGARSVSSILESVQRGDPIKGEQGDNPYTMSRSPKKQLLGTFENREFNPYSKLTTGNNSPPQQVVLPKSLIFNQSVSKVFYSAGLASSRSEGHRLLTGKGAYFGFRKGKDPTMSDNLNFVPAKATDPKETWKYVIADDPKTGTMLTPGEEGLLILRVGKWRVRIVRIVSDEKWETLGLPDPPLWSERKAEMAAGRWEVEEQQEKAKTDKIVHDMFPEAKNDTNDLDLDEDTEGDSELHVGWAEGRRNARRGREIAFNYLKQEVKKETRQHQRGKTSTQKPLIRFTKIEGPEEPSKPLIRYNWTKDNPEYETTKKEPDTITPRAPV